MYLAHDTNLFMHNNSNINKNHLHISNRNGKLPIRAILAKIIGCSAPALLGVARLHLRILLPSRKKKGHASELTTPLTAKVLKIER